MYTLCSVDAIEEESAQGFNVAGRSIFAVKKEGAVFVYVNSCPHIGIQLEFQPNQFLDTENRFIQCSNHGALFEIETGACIVGPCSGQSLIPVEFQIKDNHIVIKSGSE